MKLALRKKRRRNPTPAPIALTHPELRSVLLKAREIDYPVYVLMLIQYHHAGRNSEMIHLRAANFTDGFISYKRGKGSEPCRQRLVESKDNLLDESTVVVDFLRGLQPKERLYPRTRWTYWRHLVKIARAAGIPRHKAKTTVLKHTICTDVAEKFGLPAAQRRAGHVNGASTLRYTKMREDQVDDLIAQGV
jgi:integrase